MIQRDSKLDLLLPCPTHPIRASPSSSHHAPRPPAVRAPARHTVRQLAPDDGPGSSIAAEQHHYEAQAVTNQAKYGKTFSFTGKKATEVPSDMLASIVGSEISKVGNFDIGLDRFSADFSALYDPTCAT